jgi:hypothetical protein
MRVRAAREPGGFTVVVDQLYKLAEFGVLGRTTGSSLGQRSSLATQLASNMQNRTFREIETKSE